MHAHALSRLFLVTITLTFICTGLLVSPAAADSTTWSDTGSGEDIFVRACPGFDITTSYTANRTFKVISNSVGDQVVERMYASFVGTLVNDTTGQSLPYDGTFTRISNYQHSNVELTDVELRLNASGSRQFSVEIDRIELDLVADPVAVIKAFVSNALQSELCNLIGGAIELEPRVASYEERMFSEPAVDVHTENSALPQTTVEDDEMTPWTELDPCDTSPPGQDC